MTPPAPLPRAAGPAPEAVVVFEQGMSRLQHHEYGPALASFRDLVDRFPTEHALLDRARVYGALCERELARPATPPAPGTPEERITAATAAVNDGDNDRAEQLALDALKDVPDHDLAHYLLAVVHARRGLAAAALEALDRAVAISPDVRAQARHDADFDLLRGSDAFEQLLADPGAQSGTRRGSGARSER